MTSTTRKTWSIRPTCGHEALHNYTSPRLAKAHAQAHADRSGCPVHLTFTDVDGSPVAVKTLRPRFHGPWLPCQTARSERQAFDD
jgi:hypothetical protein